MFRVTQYMRELAQAKATGQYPSPQRHGTSQVAKDSSSAVGRQITAGKKLNGPVVIWNLIRRCNLTCKHCYAQSADHEYAGELSTEEVFTVMDDLKQFGVPVLILSGGEPLMRPDFFQIAKRSKELGFYTSLSTNGTLIDEPMAERIATIDFDYVGISLDGLKQTHDKFRRLEGAFELSLTALRHLNRRNIKTGLRFTMTSLNAHDFPALLDLMRDEGVPKFYFSHLNYAGRGNTYRKTDAHHMATRQAMDLLFERAWESAQEGRDEEFVTGNNDADGPYLLLWLQNNYPDLALKFGDALRDRLTAWGGNSSGVNVANIDNLGHVHPDTMWWHHDLGCVRDRKFSTIWEDVSDPLMAGLKQLPRTIKGRCSACQYFSICGGNTRVRAQQLTGDPWAEDPGCYLDDDEIGYVSSDSSSLSNRRNKIIPIEAQSD